jgi:hypothetical protein
VVVIVVILVVVVLAVVEVVVVVVVVVVTSPQSRHQHPILITLLISPTESSALRLPKILTPLNHSHTIQSFFEIREIGCNFYDIFQKGPVPCPQLYQSEGLRLAQDLPRRQTPHTHTLAEYLYIYLYIYIYR